MNLYKTITISFVLLGAASTLSGCLALAEPPQANVGEHCKATENCPDNTECVNTGVDTICLPLAPECGAVDDPLCAGYSCEQTFHFCHKSCNADADCATNFRCGNWDFNDNGDYLGTCSPATY